jgi:polysaccharide export outer membrane protein
MTASCRLKSIASLIAIAIAAPAFAQTAKPSTSAQSAPPVAAAAAAPRATDPVIPPGYVIGPDDLLSIVFWGDKDVSGDAVVRPDGKITVPLINEMQAAGLTPDQLHKNLVEARKKFEEDPTIYLNIKQINSRKVFITGEINKPGTYPLTTPTTVIQLIAMAGGLREYADAKKIIIMRTENGKPRRMPFNYKSIIEGKNLQQNIELKPGDTVVVP